MGSTSGNPFDMKILIMYSNHPPSPGHLRVLAGQRPNIEVVVARDERDAVEHARDAQIVLGHRYLRQSLPGAKRLKWVQSTAAGVDNIVVPELRPAGPILTYAPIFYEQIAVHAFAMALAVVRRIPEAARAQAEGRWRGPCPEIDMLRMPRTSMIIGMGRIGRAISAILRRNGIRVLGNFRRPPSDAVEHCDEILAGDSWRDSLSRVDLCFLALPLTTETTGLFDADAIGRLPSHAVLVNVGRGPTLDEAALVRRLRDGTLGGAALDVLTEIPCSRENPLWTTPRLLITPHVGAFDPDRQKALEAYIEAQVVRYLEGQELLNVVAYHGLGLP